MKLTLKSSEILGNYTKYWVCPRTFCNSVLVFEDPYLPCARHGEMVRYDEISLRKRLYKAFKRWQARLEQS